MSTTVESATTDAKTTSEESITKSTAIDTNDKTTVDTTNGIVEESKTTKVETTATKETTIKTEITTATDKNSNITTIIQTTTTTIISKPIACNTTVILGIILSQKVRFDTGRTLILQTETSMKSILFLP